MALNDLRCNTIWHHCRAWKG